MKYRRHTFLASAIASTIVLLWAGVTPSAGEAIGARHHGIAHLISYAVLAFAWRGALAQIPVSIIALLVIGFGFMQEGIEVFGHAHPYEIGDALIDALGAIVGAVFAQLAVKQSGPDKARKRE
jgi:VanZ family protein